MIVHKPGLYGVFSQLSFRFKKDEKIHTSAHKLIVRDKKNGYLDNMLTKRIIFVPDNRTEQAFEPSTLIAFPNLEDDDKVCVIIPENNEHLIYISKVDNYLNILQLV